MRTDRLALREFTAADAPLLELLDGDPAVLRFLNGGRPRSRADTERETLPRYLAEYRDTPGLGHWAAIERAGEFVGWFMLTSTGTAGEVELGYRLRRWFWGRGLATEGARALVEYAFTTLGLLRVVADTMAVNTGSRRVLEKAGLRHVRTEYGRYPDDPIPGAEHGDVYYALDRADWPG